MTKEILVVQQHSGSYDDYHVFPILATFDQEKADAKVKEMEARKQQRDINWDYLSARMDEWEKENPRPLISPIGVREDKKRAKKEGRKFDPTAYLQWANLRLAHQESIASEFGEQGQKDLYELASDTSWGIESIPFA